MTATTAPTWVRALGSVVRRLPRGRYTVVSSVRTSGPPFVAAIAGDLGGARFGCDLSDEIAREVCLTGYYEPPVTRLLQRRLRDGSRMVDAGANWGYFSLCAAALVGPSGRVLALEPDPRQFKRLTANAALNAFNQIHALPAAAAARAGTAVLSGYAENAANRGVSMIDGSERVTSRGVPRFEVACVTLDELLERDPEIDVVKIDVEGAECDVLRGMRDGLSGRKYRAIVLELHPDLLARRAESGDACIGLLADAGYRGWTIDLSPQTYARAVDRRFPSDRLLRPIDQWRNDGWPHLLWLAPGEEIR
jgi:FkbM family methyltransferase